MKILVTGGSGFLASALVKGLKAEHMMATLSRSKVISSPKNFVYASIEDPVISDAVEWADVVIHTAAQLHGPWNEMFAANVTFTRKLSDLSKKGLAKKFIYISSENVTQGNEDIYSKTKALGEEELKANPDALILRPTIIYGPGDTKYITRLKKIIRKFPIVPVLGNGKSLFQFIYVEDIVTIVRNALINGTKGTFTIAGPDCISYNELMKLLMELMGQKKPMIHLPMWMLKLLANTLDTVFRMPPLTPSQLENLKKDRQYNISNNIQVFDYVPTSMRQGLTNFISE